MMAIRNLVWRNTREGEREKKKKNRIQSSVGGVFKIPVKERKMGLERKYLTEQSVKNAWKVVPLILTDLIGP